MGQHHWYSVVLLLVLASHMFYAKDIHHRCQDDSDCTSTGVFCHLSLCEQCVPCQILNRLTPPDGCARNEEDCDSCFPGYKSNDLTNQRRSYKCIPESTLDEFTIPWNSLTYFVVGIVLLAIVVPIFATIYIKYQQRQHKETGVHEEEMKEMIPSTTRGSAPPSYDDSLDATTYDEPENVVRSFRNYDNVVGSIREDPTLLHVVRLENEALSQATPINYDRNHHFPTEDHPDEEVLGLFVEEDTAEVVDSNGSTETIPSHWEHNSTFDLTPRADSSSPAPHNQSNRHQLNGLVRSQSLELPRLHSTAWNGSNSRSDPSLPTASDGSRRRSISLAGGESYSHMHVRLSTHRIPSQSAIESSPETENRLTPSPPTVHCDTDDVSEPNAPQPFFLPDDSHLNFVQGRIIATPIFRFLSPSSAQGSQDSGFFDQSRRRRHQPVDSEEEIAEIGLFLSVNKRHRGDFS